eukprot:m.61506 g.61506  ORF g.61506 m.61506 type:complete len:953 (+) comp11868_c2_seq1:125-2983(+)
MASRVQTFRALYNFTAEESDELDLQAGDLIDVSTMHDGAWGVGTSRRTQKEGSFPWSYVEKMKTQQLHRFEPVQVTVPTIDWHTQEFIWGDGIAGEARQCTVCGFTCHKQSEFFVANNSASECIPTRNIVRPSSRPIRDWTVEDVHLFLVATKLAEYARLFLDKRITGEKLCSLNHKKLQSLGVEDTSHRAMVMACIEEALGRGTKLTETSFSARCALVRGEKLDNIEVMDTAPLTVAGDIYLVVKSHKFKVKSFANLAWCDYSRKLLFGLARQGLQCTECGYTVSRQFLYHVPSCQPETAKIDLGPPPPGTSTGHLFGVPFQTQMTGEAPTIVQQCVSAIESGKGMKTSHLYDSLGFVTKARALQAELLVNPGYDLSAEDPHVVAALLTRYLAELPEPIVPTSLYDRFIAGAALPTEDEQIAELDRMTPQLPPDSQKALAFILAHLGRVLVNYKSTKMDVHALGVVFGPLLLRPPALQMAKAATDYELQVVAVKLLIAKCKLGGSPSGEAPPLKPRKSVRGSKKGAAPAQSNYENVVLPRQPSMAQRPKPPLPSRAAARPRALSTTQPLAEMQAEPWFAGNMNRPEAEAALAPLVDGSFLVRASQTRAGYTLTVKFREIRHIVIVAKGGKFGFSEPLTFTSVAELVRHFEKQSLSYYNAELETRLAFPFKVAPVASGADYDYDDGPDDDIYVSYVSDLKKSLARQHRNYRHDGNMYMRSAHFDKQMKDLEKSLKAQQSIITMLSEQLFLNESVQQQCEPGFADVLAQQYTKIQTLYQEAKQGERQLTSKLEEVANEDRAFQEKLNAQEEAEAASQMVPQPPPVDGFRKANFELASASESLVPNIKTSTYYVGLMSRTDAAQYLQRVPDGTYLIRRADRPRNPYTLDVSYRGSIKHIQIIFDGIRFGLADPPAFASLDSMRDYYTKEELSASIQIKLQKGVRELCQVNVTQA